MKNRKQLLADFYLNLLTMSREPDFKLQWLADEVCMALANELESSPANVRMIFERMAAEDRK